MFGVIACLLCRGNISMDDESVVKVVLICVLLVVAQICLVSGKRDSYPLLLKFFILAPANNRKFFWKGGLMISYLSFKRNVLFFWKNFLNFCRNLVYTTRMNPIQIYLWRPLIKRWSYFGLYVHSRANFLKFFKNQDVK